MRKLLLISCVAVVTVLFLGSAALGQGEQIFQQNCSVCHGSQGGGASGPPLANNPNLSDTTRVLDQILNGGQAMPPFRSQLNDEQIAAVATHIRTAWGNDFGQVSPEQAAAVRAGGEAGEDAAQGAEGEGQAEAEGEAEQQRPPVTVATAEVEGESRLVDAEGMTLYRYVYEAPEGTPLCYLNCLNRWMPVLASESPQAGEGIEAGDVGTVERDDGGMQATYRGWPLYRFVGDEASGEANGDEISDVWTSITPELEAVEESVGLAAGEEAAQD